MSEITARATTVGTGPTATPALRSPRRAGRFALGGLAALAATTLALTACSSSKSSNGAAPKPSTSAAAAGGVRISAVAGHLVGPNGHHLYTNNIDTMTTIKCTGDCAQEWPPLTGTPTTTGVLQATAFATVARPDGSMQVTFQGHPLYYFAEDKSASDLKGDITEDGVLWHSADSSVVSTTGGISSAPAGSAPASSMSSSSGYGGY